MRSVQFYAFLRRQPSVWRAGLRVYRQGRGDWMSGTKKSRRKEKTNKTGRKKSRRHARRLIVLFCALCGVAVLYFAVDSGLPAGDERLITPRVAEKGTASGSKTQKEGEGDEGGDWQLILVNKWHPIPENYQVELTELSNGQSVDRRIYPVLQKMFDVARSEDVYPIVASGYRTAEKQQSLMDDKIAEYEAEGYSGSEARRKAEEWVAVPGTSEHQLGLGIDINADGIHSRGQEVYRWLEENGYKYGFIRRYPGNKKDVTGVINEPWHYRYVGVRAAGQIHSQGVCLEEYLESD